MSAIINSSLLVGMNPRYIKKYIISIGDAEPNAVLYLSRNVL